MKFLLSLLLLTPATMAATVQDWPLPAPKESAQPNLSLSPGGDLLLSWIERRGEAGHRLVFARQETGGATWSDTRTIAESKDWFVNWADFPALQELPDGSLWAHTLPRNGEATYAYDVQLQVSRDGGRTWTTAPPVHDDGTATEHGFVTLWPQARDELGIAWLDGRHTGGGHQGHDSHAGGPGVMTLRAARFGELGKRGERELDARTCDCCQTDSARIGDRGVLVAYRDRGEDEVRDISVIRHDGKTWRKPVPVHADGWVMAACPVNGPAIAARGRQAWVAWYTGAGDQPSIRIATSTDEGRSFRPMREIARGQAQHGRVDLAADASGVWVSWLEESAGRQSLWLARYAPDLSAEHFRTRVAAIQGRGRGTGFPRLQLAGGEAWLAWTEVVEGQPRLRGARVRP
ncbi:sialidase family protein [Arenimonas sp. MALMAid1274]|uniref:sialidase family protein n=1 Tax=Arenimonas sp. MALMAid1274 TaxID=3411630 RepID=UPI003B9E80C5